MSSVAAAVYDREDLRDAISRARSGGLREVLLRVDGMHCASCVRRVERALAPRVREASVNLAAGTVELLWDPRATPLSEILEDIGRLGFSAQVLEENADYRRAQSVRRVALARIGVALLCGMQVMMLASSQYFGGTGEDPVIDRLLQYAQWILATPVLLFSGWPFLHGAARALRDRALTMDVPVALALLIAYAASAWNTLGGAGHVYFDSVTMFVLLLLAGRFFESRGRAQAAEHLRRLAAARPLTATRLVRGVTEEIPAAQLAPGDTILVAPGAPVPADGTMEGGAAEFDESLITGEADPRLRRAGETVLAGAVNAGSGPARICVAATGAATTLSQITRLLHRAQQERPPVQVLADRVAGYFTAGVLALAAAGLAAWWPYDPERALAVALAVLVVTCPCALSLAMPLALAAGGSALARRGVLLARADALLRLARVDTVVFDKTGTLTTGRFSIAALQPLGDEPPQRCLEIAGALERGLRHPIASAFPAHSPLAALEQRQEPGRGVSGVINGTGYSLTRDDAPAGAPTLAELADGLTWVRLARGAAPLARIGLAQALRSDAASTVAALTSRGLSLELLSGDGPGSVLALARQLGVVHFHARLSPEQKLDRLRELQRQGHGVLAVGDGINDGPLLAGADAGVALAAGAALSQSRADAILMQDRLAPLTALFEVAARTRGVIRQNLAWALVYNLVAVPLALAGWVVPWVAALGMGASSLIVVLNSLRIARAPAAPAKVGAPIAALNS